MNKLYVFSIQMSEYYFCKADHKDFKSLSIESIFMNSKVQS